MTENTYLLSAELVHWFTFSKENSQKKYTHRKIVNFQSNFLGLLH